MLFDTHCHLNFKAFEGRVEEVVQEAKKAGVKNIVIPGTDIETSKKAIKIANSVMVRQAHHDSGVTLSSTKSDEVNIYAAVGIHPHHVYQCVIARRETTKQSQKKIATVTSSPRDDINQIEKILIHPKVVAVGEIGIDRHHYQRTKHQDYKVDEEFVELQKVFFTEQVKLAIDYKKALIIHNREAKKEILEILSNIKDLGSKIKAVFHCCEPDEELLQFAMDHKMYIGVDGDVVYWKAKQEFVKKAPLDMLVLETDSPYLSPFRKFPNEPKNVLFIADFIAKLKGIKTEKVQEETTLNAENLFGISK